MQAVAVAVAQMAQQVAQVAQAAVATAAVLLVWILLQRLELPTVVVAVAVQSAIQFIQAKMAVQVLSFCAIPTQKQSQ
jgi:hypothetical protein